MSAGAQLLTIAATAPVVATALVLALAALDRLATRR